MIKAEDLRLNNIVKMPSSGELTKITSMDISDIQSNLKNRLPVDLSEEILLKVGFTKESTEYYYIDHEHINFLMFYSVHNNNYYHFTDADRRCYHSTLEIKHLHQLQNLYFTLTGQELNTAGLI